MSNIWKPRPPSFPSDDKIPFTAAEVNEFDDIQDLNVKGDNERKASEAEIDLNSVQTSRLMRARDSVYIRRKQRDSVVSTFEETDEDSVSISESHSARNVKFRPKSREEDKESVDNQVFEDEDEVVYRRRTVNLEKHGEDSERNE